MVSDFQVARWDFTVFRRLDRVCSSYLQSTKKPQKIRVSSSYPNQSEPLHNLFRVSALLNLRLHRRVKLLVLESSLLEFRVLVISCHAAAAPSSSPLPSTTTAYPPLIRIHIPPPIRIHIPPPICIHISPPLSYTTTAAIYHNHISTTNPSSSHIRFVLETPGQFLGQKFPYPIFRLFWVFWATCHHSDFLSHFFVVAALISEKKLSQKFRAHPVSLS